MSQYKEKEIELRTKMQKHDKPITMIFYSDGAIAFSEGTEDFIYLYPDVVKKLKRLLKDAKTDN